MMSRMAELIAERIAPWKEVPILQEIFHSEDPKVVARTLYEFCEAELGQQPAEALFFFASVGVVFGLQMPDKRRIVIKVHKPERSLSFLSQMGKVQHYLAAQGYPCPRPLAAPRPLANGLATIDELIDEGIFRDAHEPVIRKAIAMALFQHIQLLHNVEQIGVDQTPFDQRLPPDILWPKPHNAIFNFEATSDGAEWIDTLAWKVKRVLERDELPPVLVHNDFSANQMRFVDNHLQIVYDWDSLTLKSELIRVGNTAANFTYTEQPGIANSGTTQEDTQAFIADYEAARQKPFTVSEQKIIKAGMLSGKLYGARCWHALHPQEPTFSREWYDTMLADYKSIF
jgi:aminoglycoside phosphotransferase (APT) family kinase protein